MTPPRFDTPAPHDDLDEHREGLRHDLPHLIDRRRALGGLLGVAGLATLTACGTSDANTGSTSASTPSGAPADGPPDGAGPPDGGVAPESADVPEGTIPEETNGPYPADGTTDVDVLDDTGIVRRDIRTSTTGRRLTADGVPLTLRLRVLDVSGGSGGGYRGAALYAWQCDRQGRYSMYDDDLVDENYLRGIQVADRRGWLELTTIFPACYPGRWPHVHVEVYPDVRSARSGSDRLRTSQLALPRRACEAVYATDGYEASIDNLAEVSLRTDGVFSDGWSLQLAKVTGSPTTGYTATLAVPV